MASQKKPGKYKPVKTHGCFNCRSCSTIPCTFSCNWIISSFNLKSHHASTKLPMGDLWDFRAYGVSVFVYRIWQRKETRSFYVQHVLLILLLHQGLVFVRNTFSEWLSVHLLFAVEEISRFCSMEFETVLNNTLLLCMQTKLPNVSDTTLLMAFAPWFIDK